MMKRNSAKRIGITALTAILSVVLAWTACATDMKDVLGKWGTAQADESMYWEFFKDGTVIMSVKKGQGNPEEVVGSYSFLDETRMKVTFKGRTRVMSVSVSGKEMTHVTSEYTMKLTRIEK